MMISDIHQSGLRLKASAQKIKCPPRERKMIIRIIEFTCRYLGEGALETRTTRRLRCFQMARVLSEDLLLVLRLNGLIETDFYEATFDYALDLAHLLEEQNEINRATAQRENMQ